jgi:menaquinone-9 beta-reductase
LEVLTPSQPSPFSSKMGKVSAEGSREEKGRWGQAFFDFFPVPNNIAGYVWDFPTQIRGVPMRCWGIYDTNILASEKRPQLKESLEQEMSRLGFDLNQYEIQGHPIRWFTPENEMSVPRVLLVGDAVGADPVFGEGISIALGYGAIAAREISQSFQRREFSFGGYRRRVLRSALGQTLIARWIIAYLIYPIKWRWFQILLWRFLKPIVILIAWLFVLNWGKRIR